MTRTVCLLLVAASAVLVAACGVGGTAGGEQAAAGGTTGSAVLCDGAVAVMSPFSGSGDTDLVQMNWARVALDKFNQDHQTSFTLAPYNVDFDPEAGEHAARTIVADQSVIGVVGPKTSAVTKVAGPIFDTGGLVYVSPSATNATLTDGSLKRFYRVVASDALQAPAMADFVLNSLEPQTVLIVQDDEPYSQGLGDAVAAQLTSSGVDVKRQQVKIDQQSYSSVITQVSPTVNVVVAPLLVPSDALRLANELHAAGKFPAIIGGDALFNSAFRVPGAYVTTYAPDISLMPEGRDIIRLYQSIFGSFEAYGGPAYVAMQVILTAAYDVCQRTGRITRHDVALAVPKVHLEETVLGRPVAFNEYHELEGAQIHVYRVTANGFELIR